MCFFPGPKLMQKDILNPHMVLSFHHIGRKFSCSLSKVCLWRSQKWSESTVLGLRMLDWNASFSPQLSLPFKFYALFSGGGGRRKRKVHTKSLLKLSMQDASRVAVFIQLSLEEKSPWAQRKYNSINEARLSSRPVCKLHSPIYPTITMITSEE